MTLKTTSAMAMMTRLLVLFFTAYSPFFLPQLSQKFPVMPVLPQAQSQVAGASGFFAPQFGQNFPALPFWPQAQSQVFEAAGSGFFVPQLGQNLLAMPFWPQAQSQVSEFETGVY